MEMLLQELIEMVKGATPALWEAAMRRVTATAIADSLVALFLAVAAVTGAKIVLGYMKEQLAMESYDRNDSFEFVTTFSWIGIVLASVIVLLEVYAVIMYLVSPEIAAIQVLVGLVK